MSRRNSRAWWCDTFGYITTSGWEVIKGNGNFLSGLVGPQPSSILDDAQLYIILWRSRLMSVYTYLWAKKSGLPKHGYPQVDLRAPDSWTECQSKEYHFQILKSCPSSDLDGRWSTKMPLVVMRSTFHIPVEIEVWSKEHYVCNTSRLFSRWKDRLHRFSLGIFRSFRFWKAWKGFRQDVDDALFDSEADTTSYGKASSWAVARPGKLF